MANRVKGITVEIGGDVTGLDKALSKVNKNIRDTQGELKDVERLLKLDPGNVELLAQKQRLLAKAIDQTEDKLDSLKKAEKQVQDQFKRGKASQQQVDALRREIIQTENQLDGFRQSARQAQHAVNQIDEDPVEDVKRAAKEAEGALDDAGDSASTFGDVLSAGAVIEGVKAVVGAVGELRDATEEYRKIMGTLEVSSEAAGYSADQTEEAYRRLYGVLGDEQAAATTVANLQAMGLDQATLLETIDMTTGAWAKYGDSIPIDGLAEAINETAKAGRITGVLADAINWGAQEGETYGIALREATEENEEWNQSVQDCASAEDFFNLALQECSSEGDRAKLIMEALRKQGLDKLADAWRKDNAGIVAANDAQEDYMKNAREIAEKTDPAAIAAKEGMADVLGKIAEALDKVDMDQLVQHIDKFFEAVGEGAGWLIDHSELVLGFLAAFTTAVAGIQALGLAAKLGQAAQGVNAFATAFPGVSSAIMSFLGNPYVLLVAALVAFVALVGAKGDEMQAHLEKVDSFMQNVFAKDFTETLGFMGEPLNVFRDHFKNLWDNLMDHATGMINFWRGVFTGDWKRVWLGVKQVFGAIWGQIVTVARAPINLIIGMVNGMVSAVESGVNGAIKLLNLLPGINLGEVSLPRISSLGGQKTGPQKTSAGQSSIINQRPSRLPQYNTGLGSGPYGRPVAQPAPTPSINITQNNYSPKALSTYDTYRQSQALGRQIRRVVGG